MRFEGIEKIDNEKGDNKTNWNWKLMKTFDFYIWNIQTMQRQVQLVTVCQLRA